MLSQCMSKLIDQTVTLGINTDVDIYVRGMNQRHFTIPPSDTTHTKELVKVSALHKNVR